MKPLEWLGEESPPFLTLCLQFTSSFMKVQGVQEIFPTQSVHEYFNSQWQNRAKGALVKKNYFIDTTGEKQEDYATLHLNFPMV